MPALIDDAAIALAAIGLGLSGIREILTFISSIKKVDELVDTIAKDLAVFASILSPLQDWYQRYTSSANQWYGNIQVLNDAIESCSQCICRTFRYFETKYGRAFNKSLSIQEAMADTNSTHAAKSMLRKMYHGTKLYFGGSSALVDFRWELAGVKYTLSIALQLVQLESQDRDHEEHQIIIEKLNKLEEVVAQANQMWALQVSNTAKPEPLRQVSDTLQQTMSRARSAVASRRNSRVDSPVSSDPPVLSYSPQMSNSRPEAASVRLLTTAVNPGASRQGVSTQSGRVQAGPATLAFRGAGFMATLCLNKDTGGVLSQLEEQLRSAYRTSGRPTQSPLDYSQGAILHILRSLPRRDAYMYVNLGSPRGRPPRLSQVLGHLQVAGPSVSGGSTEACRLPFQWDVSLVGQPTAEQTVLRLRPV